MEEDTKSSGRIVKEEPRDKDYYWEHNAGAFFAETNRGPNINLNALNRARIARALGVSDSTLSFLFTGRSTGVSYIIVFRIAQLIGVTMDALVKALLVQRVKWVKMNEEQDFYRLGRGKGRPKKDSKVKEEPKEAKED